MFTPTVLIEYDRSAAERETEQATFGTGCFWGPDAAFGALDGVIRTRVGYAGGTKPDPTYSVLGDHTEVVQVEFDPERLTYQDILGEIFSSHNPCNQAKKRQYQNVILAETEDQYEAILDFLAASAFSRDEIETRIETLSQFHPAENYHQKYNLRGKRWLTESFDEAGYDAEDIRESPAAAKLNAHVAGHDVSVPFLDARTR